MKTIEKKLKSLDLELVIGLETHVELNTKTKVFCDCKNQDSKTINQHTCPICRGEDLAQLKPNLEAIGKTIKIGLALDSDIAEQTDWDRKHYDYPDLPKGYQLTQLEHPIIKGGVVSCHRTDGSVFQVELEQIHLEEDAGKILRKAGKEIVDFNRAGRALIEIVTKPVIHSIPDAITYLSSIQTLVRALGISHADMEKGQLRSDVSISLRKKGSKILHARTEIKNINSFKFAREALIKDATRQMAYREEHSTAPRDQFTIAWDEEKKDTKIMRTKERQYKFSKETAITPLDLTDLKSEILIDKELLPFAIEKQLVAGGLDLTQAKYFSADSQKAKLLFTLQKKIGDLPLLAKVLIHYVPADAYQSLDVEKLVELLLFAQKQDLSQSVLKEMITLFLQDSDFVPEQYLQQLQQKIQKLDQIIDQKLAEDSPLIQSILQEKSKAINMLVGEIVVELQDRGLAAFIKEKILEKIDQKAVAKKSDLFFKSSKSSAEIAILPSYRNIKIKELSEKDLGKEFFLTGWIASMRDHGDLVFIDLREDASIFQIKCSRDEFTDLEQIKSIKKESVILVHGIIVQRDRDDINPSIPSGTIELTAREIKILSHAKDLPFEIKESKKVNEQQRLQYRFLDLRNETMHQNLLMRYQITKEIRDFLGMRDFMEIETPLLSRGSDEGSREFVVPSRLHAESFYVLPQAPQQFKQMLMLSGIDRYFQIARCFRDEDDKGDRQPEFTQLDLEMAFSSPDEIMETIEIMLLQIVSKYYVDKKLLTPKFTVLTYAEAMEKYGTDKPDLRFGLEMQDITAIVAQSGFKVFQEEIDQGGMVKCLKIEKILSKKEIQELTDLAIQHGLGGLAYIVVHEDAFQSPIIKYLGEDIAKQIVEKMLAKAGGMIFFAASDSKTTNKALDQVRRKLGEKLKLYDQSDLSFAWIVDFPMFEKTEEGRWKFTHNPFSLPQIRSLTDFLAQNNIQDILAQQYDLVLNGHEIGGGSMRAHTSQLLKTTYQIMAYSDEEIKHSIGHMLDAFEYGAPPHGGIALGLDRLLMVLQGESSIREVIAFPKNGSAQDLLFGAPSKLEK